MFRAQVLIVRRAKIVLYSLWYHHTYRWPSRAQIERGLSQPVHLQWSQHRCLRPRSEPAALAYKATYSMTHYLSDNKNYFHTLFSVRFSIS